MERAASIDDFVANPVGRYFAGNTHFICCHSPSLCGSAHWGRPTEADVRDLVRLFEVARNPILAGGYCMYMDSRALEVVEWGAMNVLMQTIRERIGEWGKVITRHAVVVPPGPAGALVAGMAPLVGLTYPMRFFSQRSEALRWLAHPEARDAIGVIQPLVDAERGLSPVVRAVRRYLERALDSATIEGAAHEATLTPRSLQRELRRQQTSFSEELHTARLRAACELLAFSDEKIEVIARRVGCATSSQLSTFFRRELGESPAEYRARHKT